MTAEIEAARQLLAAHDAAVLVQGIPPLMVGFVIGLGLGIWLTMRWS